MTVTEKPTLRFSLKILPWLVVLAALAIYVATANRWVTFASLPVVGKLLGWDWWSTQTVAPLNYLITLPLTMVSQDSAPGLMNALSAVLAALTLGTLARTVALLPQDRTREQRQKDRNPNGLLGIPTNWIPPVFAILALGFQMTFWEHATAATGEMLNLLLFAHVVRCLLEYRQAQKEHWLYQFVFVYGLATANNWAMIGFFPLFLLALVWFRGKSFFQLKFLSKLVIFGLLGLCLYLVMPLVESSRGNGQFGALFHEQLGTQKQILKSIPLWMPLMLSLVVFIPLLSMTIRWPSNMSEANPIAAFLTLLMFYLIHAVFLGFSIWVMFDPTYSPRMMGLGLPFLTFYYLIALNIGYYSGYFLLVFRQSEQRGWKRQSSMQNGLAWLITVAVWAGPVVVAGLLIQRNLPTIRGNNIFALREYSKRIVASLPDKGAMLLSEEPHLLLLLEAYYAANGKNPHMLIDTRSLPYARYQSVLAKHYPDRWMDLVTGKSLPDPLPVSGVVQLIGIHAQSNKFFYLHPTSGPQILEHFHPEPRGVIFEMRPYQTNQLLAATPTPEEEKQNDAFWQEQRDFLNQLQPYVKNPYCGASVVGRYLSRSLNEWGVALNHAGQTNAAQKYFDDAIMMNPANVAAKFNKAGEVGDGDWDQGRTWSAMLRENGSFCVPKLQHDLGRTLAASGLYRQALEQLAYAVEAKPEQVEYRLTYGNVLLLGKVPEHALKVLEPLRGPANSSEWTTPMKMEFVRQEANAHIALKDYKQAESILTKAHTEYPKEEVPMNGLLATYLAQKNFSEALAVIKEQLTINPKNVTALMNQGAVHLEKGDVNKAIESLNQARELAPKNRSILMNLAMAKFRNDDLKGAEESYASLAQADPKDPVPYYFLGEIALKEKRKPEAIAHFEKFLKLASPNTREAALVQQRLKELKGS